MKRRMRMLAMGVMAAWLAVAAAAVEARMVSVKGPDGKTRYYDVSERTSWDGSTTNVTIYDLEENEYTKGTWRRGIWENKGEFRNLRTGETTTINLGADPYFTDWPE